jgi:hypothetical protein
MSSSQDDESRGKGEQSEDAEREAAKQRLLAQAEAERTHGGHDPCGPGPAVAA